MALPRRKEKEILLDPGVIERVKAVKKMTAANALVQGFETDDSAQRLRAMSAFDPDEQRALRDEIAKAFGPQAPLDLPELSSEEATYLEPEEQRNVKLTRAFQMRGVSEPTLATGFDTTLTQQERLRRQNDEYERILRQDTGVRKARPGAAVGLITSVITSVLGDIADVPVIPEGK